MFSVRPTILNAEPSAYSPRAKSILQSIGTVRDLAPHETTIEAHLPHIQALIVRLGYQVDAEMLSKAKQLRFVATATTGLDHIDVEAAESLGIYVLSLRNEQRFLRSIPATAEHTWCLLLSLMRRLPAAFNSVKAGEWDRDRFKGHDLCGKTLGIIGLGRIGERVATIAAAFGMRVFAYDPFLTQVPQGVTLLPTLNDLLIQSDVLSVHVPLNDDNVHLLTDDQFASMKPGTFLINTSRGSIVDSRALLSALTSGSLAGAALDVVEDERSVHRPLLDALTEFARRNDNLIITPHIGGATFDSMESTEIFMARKLAKAFQQAFVPISDSHHVASTP